MGCRSDRNVPGDAGETMITYETDRLWLRPFCHEDLDLIFRLYTDPEILRYTPFDVMSKATAKLHLARIIQDWEQVPQQSFEFAMIRKEECRYQKNGIVSWEDELEYACLKEEVMKTNDGRSPNRYILESRNKNFGKSRIAKRPVK